MEKKQQTNEREEPKSFISQKKVFGGNALQLSEEDASRLVGCIVERGISEKPPSNPTLKPFPKPTVLPFPVARHRSHGPHWRPVSRKAGGVENEDSDNNIEDDEDKAFMELDPVASLAKPVQRKEKKGLDLSKWKEIVQDGDSSMGKKSEEDRLSSRLTKGKTKDEEGGKVVDKKTSSFDDKKTLASKKVDAKPHLNNSDGENINLVSAMELDNSNQVVLKENVKDARVLDDTAEAKVMPEYNQVKLEKMPDYNFGSQDMLRRRCENNLNSGTMASCFGSNNIRNEQDSMSLKSQIDAENRARISQMTAEEIAEAQAEIMEKMSPALLKLLKKRGQGKPKKENRLNSEVGTGSVPVCQQVESIQDEKCLPGPPLTGNDVSHLVMSPSTKYTENKLDGVKNLATTSNTATSSSWNAWSNRVEAARELRFSLGGDVVENDNMQISVNDNVAERDYLRTEGDPSAAGYTIKEAVALTRSVVPGQRALALHLLSSVLEKALQNMCKTEVGHMVRNENKVDKSADWEAVWAFALGPEPELALSLRMCLDDNHNSVVLACTKVIQCLLSCDVNESFFDASEKIAICDEDIYTAPVFRSKPHIDVGFLHGGFWKYSAKPSNILPFSEDSMDNETEGTHTIQDDIVVAGQDFTAGLVRMGILPRLRYLLETDPTAPLEECIVTILVAIARHSPSCANAVLKCQRLIQTIVHRFTVDNVEIRSSMIKSVTLFKVLARSDKKTCLGFIKNGYFQAMTWHLYQHLSSIDQWVKLGKEKCKLRSALIVEQLRFWKVCVQYGYCISYFSDIFATLCLWLNPPSFKKLIENNVLNEFLAISREAYLVLESLARRLPNFFAQQQPSNQLPEFTGDDTQVWSWSYIGPMVDLAIKWIATRTDPEISKLFEGQKEGRGEFAVQDLSVAPLLWVYAAIAHMLFRVLERVSPEDTVSSSGTDKLVPWLPIFVPKIGLEFIKYWLQGFSVPFGMECNGDESFIKELIYLRQESDHEISLASVCCLNGMVKIITTIDNLIQSAKIGICNLQRQEQSLSKEGKLLEDGILNGSLVELRLMLNFFTSLVATGWHCTQSIETFGRGGPAPGVGIGWGAFGGGFWSKTILLAQTEARFLIDLVEIFEKVSVDLPIVEETAFTMQIINSALGLCLTAGPRDRIVMEKALDLMFHVPVLKKLDFCIRHFLHSRRGKTLGWQYVEEDYMHFNRMLSSHFRSRWLSVKVKSKAMDGNGYSGIKNSQKDNAHLDTIYEDSDLLPVTNPTYTSSAIEWAHQRLPLPTHFFLSPISTILRSKQCGPQKVSTLHFIHDATNLLEVAKSGLFFVLGLEAICNSQGNNTSSPVHHVSLTWKLHSLSVNFLVGMELLEQEQGRDTFEALQDLYGELLDKARLTRREEAGSDNKSSLDLLRFQSEIHESYSTFIEELVEQFSAISYGDMIFSRQVALYLHRCVESSVRLAAWNALSNAQVLELLPPLDKCCSGAEGYLEPVEDNEGILEAYVKSWTSGALDRAAIRGSVAYALVIHHLSSFIFHVCPTDMLLLRNRLARFLLRDYARKPQHEAMMLNLIHHKKPSTSYVGEQLENSWLQSRLQVLVEACEGNSSLLREVKKLKASAEIAL